MDPRFLYMFPFLLATASMGVTLAFIWPRRRSRGAGYLMLFCLSAALWSFCEGLLYLGLDPERNLFITQVQYLGISTAPPLIFLFIMELFGEGHRLPPALRVLLPLLSLAILLLAWTNGLHQLVWAQTYLVSGGPFPMLGLVHGPAFWLYMIFCYFLLFLCAVVLWRRNRRAAPVHRHQARVILGALIVSWLASGIYLMGLSPVPNLDPTPLTFTVVGAAMVYGFRRHHLLDLIPVARSEVFQSLEDVVLVLDGRNRLLDLNPAGELLLGQSRAVAVGRGLLELHSALVEPRTRRDPAGRTRTELPWPDGRAFDLRTSPLTDRRGHPLGRILVLRDISPRKKLEEELRQLASTDPLTGARNRRSFWELGEAALARTRRHGRPLTAIMIDIDHFKQINDRYGHQAGDQVLVALVEICRQELRESDLFGRLGGEEFAALLEETGIEAGRGVAERLARRIAALEVNSPRGPVGFTVSMGVAALSSGGETLEELLNRSDQALYQAKDAGRDRVALAAAADEGRIDPSPRDVGE